MSWWARDKTRDETRDETFTLWQVSDSGARKLTSGLSRFDALRMCGVANLSLTLFKLQAPAFNSHLAHVIVLVDGQQPPTPESYKLAES